MSDIKPLAHSSSRCRRAIFDSDDKFRQVFKWLAMTRCTFLPLFQNAENVL